MFSTVLSRTTAIRLMMSTLSTAHLRRSDVIVMPRLSSCRGGPLTAAPRPLAQYQYDTRSYRIDESRGELVLPPAPRPCHHRSVRGRHHGATRHGGSR